MDFWDAAGLDEKEMCGMKNLGIVGMVLVLTGCAVLPKVALPVNEQEVFTLESAYGVAQSAAVGYTALARCTPGTHASVTNVCSEAGVVVALAGDNRKALIALRTLESFVRNPANYPNLSYSVLLASAQSAMQQFKDLESTSGVK